MTTLRSAIAALSSFVRAPLVLAPLVLGMVAWTLVKAGRPVPGKLQIPGTRSETNPRSKPGE